MVASTEKSAKANLPEAEMVESLNDSKEITDSDVERNAAADYSGAVKKTDPKEIALVKKLDYRIMPILWAMYFMNYVSVSQGSLCSAKEMVKLTWLFKLDRNAIANARLNDLEKDLGLEGTQYNTCISILFVG